MPRTGRPKKEEGARKSAHINLRLTEALHSQIQKAAAKNERSFSDEVTSRLETSFDVEETLEMREFGTRWTYAVCLMMAKAISEVEDWSDVMWDQNAFVFEQSKIATNIVFEAFRPKGDPSRVPEGFPNLSGVTDDERSSMMDYMGREILEVGLGKICGEQVVRWTQSAVRSLRQPPDEFDTDQAFGADLRVAIQAAKRLLGKLTLPDQTYDNPMYWRGDRHTEHPSTQNREAMTIPLFKREGPKRKGSKKK